LSYNAADDVFSIQTRTFVYHHIAIASGFQ